MLNIHKYIPQLVPLYNEPQRSYHSLQHIHALTRMINTKSYVEMLDNKKCLKLSNVSGDYVIANADAAKFTHDYLTFVAWFHDCYYDPYAGSPQNEITSAKIFERMVWPDVTSEDDKNMFFGVSQGILKTARHLEDIATPNGAFIQDLIFMDMDMSGFSDENEFKRNDPMIRAELYKSSDREYLEGRIKFLTKLNAKKRIYYVFKDEFEEKARANITKAIAIATLDLDALLS